jgi:hypothetical protein
MMRDEMEMQRSGDAPNQIVRLDEAKYSSRVQTSSTWLVAVPIFIPPFMAQIQIVSQFENPCQDFLVSASAKPFCDPCELASRKPTLNFITTSADRE